MVIFDRKTLNDQDKILEILARITKNPHKSQNVLG